jgi:protein SCO1/2
MRAGATSFHLVVAIVIGLVLLGHPSASRASTPTAATEKPRTTLPDIAINLPGGEQVMLSSLWQDRPLLVTLFYNRCTGTCSPFLRSLKRAVAEAGGLGKEYRVVSLSFDPEDTVEDMRARAEELEIDNTDGWLLGTAGPESIKQVADAVGFWYRYDASNDQFDHPSQIAAVRDGRIVRVLLGTTVVPRRLRDLLLEANGVFVPFYAQPGKAALLSCFQFNERTNELTLDWGLLILLFPGVAALGVAYAIFRQHPTA